MSKYCPKIYHKKINKETKELEKENKRLKFLLILGDGSYDNKKLNQNTSVLTYQSLNSINENNIVIQLEEAMKKITTGEKHAKWIKDEI